MNKKMIDLTLPITHEMKVFPGSPQPVFLQWSKFVTHGYDSEVMFLGTHTGTHMDAPSHFSPNSKSLIKFLSIDLYVVITKHYY